MSLNLQANAVNHGYITRAPDYFRDPCTTKKSVGVVEQFKAAHMSLGDLDKLHTSVYTELAE